MSADGGHSTIENEGRVPKGDAKLITKERVLGFQPAKFDDKHREKIQMR